MAKYGNTFLGRASSVSAAVLLLMAARVGAGEPAAAPVKPTAAEVLAQAHAFCSRLNSLACEIEYLHVERHDNRRIERRATFDFAVQRPNLLSILLKNDGNVTYAWISDGENVSTYLAGVEKYMRERAPMTLDALLASTEMSVVNGTLDHAFLLDDLLRTGNGQRLPAGAQSAEYVALEELNGDKAHRLRLTVPPNTWDIWIADSPTPLPLKVHADVSSAAKPGTKVEFTVEFKRWLPDVKLDPRVFQFDAKSKAKRVSGFLEEPPPHPLLNQPAPAAMLEALDGERTTLAAHKGRDVVVLDFWSVGCLPCIGLLPKVDGVARKFKDRGVAFYAMNENDAPGDVRAFFKSRGITLTATLRNKTANFDAFKVDAIPMLFVIDKNGTIRAVHGVLTNDLAAELSAQLEALLAGRELPKPKREFDER